MEREYIYLVWEKEKEHAVFKEANKPNERQSRRTTKKKRARNKRRFSVIVTQGKTPRNCH